MDQRNIFIMKKLLFVNACIRRQPFSRTERLARKYLSAMLEKQKYQLETLLLEDTFMQPLTAELLARREAACRSGDFSDRAFDLARSFAAADEVVIAAPYWDLSFPAALKLYVEQICVNGITFCYSETGRPCGLTKIKKVVYLTTAGGYINGSNFGFEYIKGVFSTLFNISNIAFFSAEGLDICGNDPEKILATAADDMLATLSELN